MALGDIYTEKEVDEAIDQLLPVYNQGSGPKIDRDTVRTFVRAENMGDKGGVTFANRRSPVGATGVMQVMPDTIKGLKRTKHLAPDFPEDLTEAPLTHQVLAGIATIREMADRTKTDDWKTLAKHYNGGTAVGNGVRPMSAETEGYLIKGMRAREMMGIADTELPPTTVTAQASPAFKNSPLGNANTVYHTMQTMIPAIQSALFGNQAVAAQQGQNQIAAVQAAGVAAAESARLQAEITIGEDNFQRALLKSVGLDINNPDSALTRELQREAFTRNQREALDKKITEFEGVSFFENPLKFLSIQGEHKEAVAQYNNLANVENRSNQEIARMQTLATTLKSLTPAKSADLIRSKAQKDAEALLAKTQFDVAQITERNSAGQAKAMMDMWTHQGNVFQIALQLEGREWSIKHQQAQFDALLEDRADRAAARKLTAEAKAEKDAQEAVLVNGINTFKRAIAGGTMNLNKEDIKKLPAEVRNAWYGVIIRGSYGETYSQAVPFIREFGNAAGAAESGNAALVQTVRNIDARVSQKAIEIRNRENAKNIMAPINEKTARLMAYEEIYAEDARLANKGAIKEIPSHSAYALDMDAIAVTAAKNPTTVVAKIIADTKNQAQNQSINGILTPRMLVEKVKARVVAGEIAPAIAAQELSNFYKQAYDQQYDSAGLRYLGLSRFNDFIITPGRTGTKAVDLYNPAQVENYLTSEIIKSKRADAMPFGTVDLFNLNPVK